jgi:hypothetical protein
VKQLKDLMYLEEQRQQRKKVEEVKRLPWETKEQRRCEDPKTWKHYFAKVEEANIHAKAADLEGTTCFDMLPFIKIYRLEFSEVLNALSCFSQP